MYGTTIGGTTFALDARTGATVWKRDMGRRFASSPSFYKGRLILNGVSPGRLWSLNARTGRIVWSRPLVSEPSTARSEGAPLVLGGTIYISMTVGTNQGQIAAFGRGGRSLWRRAMYGRTWQAPTWTGRHIVAADYWGNVRALWRPHGWTAWSSWVGGAVYAHANSVRGRIYVHAKNGVVYALRPSDGLRLWKRRTGDGVGYAECAATRYRVWCANGWRDNRLSSWTRHGRLLWTRTLPGQVMGAVVLTRKMLWVGIHQGVRRGDKTPRLIMGLDPATGKTRIHFNNARYDPLAATRNILYLVHYSRLTAIRETSR